MYIPLSNITILKITNNKNIFLNESETFQHIQEIYKINTTTPLMYTKTTTYFKNKILDINTNIKNKTKNPKNNTLNK